MCNSNESTIVSIVTIEAFLNRSDSAFQSLPSLFSTGGILPYSTRVAPVI
ncbi:hypothetical protein QP401_08925 [Staphylococcus pettenkoferi]|nr:hypothetical protein [Staphylococcus pettenkoferi]